MSIEEARQRGITKTVQGNLDPSYLIGSWDEIEKRAKRIVEQGVAHPGHIFNLGHGVFPEVDPDVLKRLTDLVHTYSRELISQKSN